MADHAEHHDGAHHSASHYVKIWGVLLVLLIISIAGPEIAPAFGSAAKWIVLVTAFGIAFVKAWLVVKHFMHLTVEKPIVWYMLITCLLFCVLFFAGVSPDVMKHDGRNWTNKAAHAEKERVLAEVEAAERVADGQGAQVPTEEPSDAEKKSEATPIVETISFANLSTDEQKVDWLRSTGEQVYLHGGEEQAGSACVVCHRVSGAGHADIYPTLVGQDAWLSDCATLSNIIKNGLNEPITIDEKVYTQPMPPNPGLTEIEVAAVATYVRTSFGNSYGACMP